MHYPPETTTIYLIVKLLAMYKQATDKDTFLGLLKDFQDKVVNEDATISHKMLGPNFEAQINELYPYFYKAFASEELSAVSLTLILWFFLLHQILTVSTF